MKKIAVAVAAFLMGSMSASAANPKDIQSAVVRLSDKFGGPLVARY